MERSFALDTSELEKRFYALSRTLHPDRFTTSGPSAREASLERMSFLNEAYRTLKNRQELRRYRLELEGIKLPEQTGERAQIPIELAEAWFELQEALMEDPIGAAKKLGEFEVALNQLRSESETELRRIESKIDELSCEPSQAAMNEALELLGKKLQSQSYLNSMERDVARVRSKLS